MAFALAPLTLVLIAIVVVVAALQATLQYRRNKKQVKLVVRRKNTSNNASSAKGSDDLEIAQPILPPGPTPLPILGNAHNLAEYKNCPYEGFTALGKKYGRVYSLSLGGTPHVVVGNFNDIKEVLITKGNKFDARPDLLRFKLYFGGDREKSLALCDYSELQKKRITMVRNYLTFRGEKSFFESFENSIAVEMPVLKDKLDRQLNKTINAKEILSYCAMNIFTGYMCSKKFDYQDEIFQDLVRKYDYIFEDINNSHVIDVLPILAPFFSSYINSLKNTTSGIKKFIMNSVIQEKYKQFQENPNRISDILDICFLMYEDKDENERWDWDTILYIMEDLLGGSSAISNIIMRFLGYILLYPEAMQKLQEEIDNTIGRDQVPLLSNKKDMLYSQATVYEILRITSSPIVPHVATEDTSIGGYAVEKGSVIILNNYEMNTNPDLWDEPDKFMPERFIVDGNIKKPAHFIPFSTGKRSCVGVKIVVDIVYIVTTTILQRYNVSLPEGVTPQLPKGKISLAWDCFDMIFTLRD
ncbi:hypothetical protein SK128_002540 [Halocaridina rubra]|uniref:Cytochrome P450 n=1 Tax=Halocaridina rubra TaxID=373956 RepID=A0AAN8X7D2_HALRR